MSKYQNNVLMLASLFPLVEYDGGNGLNLFRLAKALAKDYCNLDVVAPSHYTVDDFQKMHGITVYRFRYWFTKRLQILSYGNGFMKNINDHFLAKLQIIPWFLSYYYLCRRLMKKKKYDAIHANFLNTAIVCALLPISSKITKLYTIRNPGLVDSKNALKIKLMQYVFDRMDQIVVNSNESKNKLLEKHSNIERKINVICGGVDKIRIDKSDFKYIREKYNIPLKTKVIISVGRLAKIKNFDYLINGFKKAIDSAKNFQLIIIGAGPEKNYLEKLIGDDKRIRLLGRINNLEVIKWYNASDLFVLTSSGDTGPIVILEALRAGLPIISTGVGYSLDFIKNGKNGFIIKKRDTEDLVEKLNIMSSYTKERIQGMSRYTKILFDSSNSYSQNSAYSYFNLYYK